MHQIVTQIHAQNLLLRDLLLFRGSSQIAMTGSLAWGKALRTLTGQERVRGPLVAIYPPPPPPFPPSNALPCPSPSLPLPQDMIIQNALPALRREIVAVGRQRQVILEGVPINTDTVGE